ASRDGRAPTSLPQPPARSAHTTATAVLRRASARRLPSSDWLCGGRSRALLVVGGQDGRDGRHLLAGLEVHHPDAGGVTALRRDLAHRRADHDAAAGDDEDLVVDADHERGNDEALLRGEL